MTFEIIVLLVGLIFLSNKKPDWTLTLIVFLSLNYMGLGGSSSPIASESIGRLNATLILSVFFTYYCFAKFRHPLRMKYLQKKVHNILTFYFIFIIFLILVDLIIRHTALWDVFRTQRHWLFLLFWMPLCKVPVDVLKKTIRHLYVFTIIISIIIFLEGVTGYYVFTHRYIDNSTSVVDLDRGALSSFTAFLYIFMLYGGYEKLSKWMKYALILMMIYIIVDSAVRSAFIGLGIGLVIMAYYLSANKVKSMGKVILAVSLLAALIYSSPVLRTRFMETEELSSALQDGGEVEGSMSYRTQMVLERIDYISENPEEFLFGVGSVPSDNFTKHVFLINPDSPFDSGDIAWTSIVCRTGMVGTALFVYMSIIFSLYFYKNKRESLFSLPMAAYITIWIFPLSFASYIMQFGYFWILPLIFLNVVAKEKSEKLLTPNNPKCL